MIGSVLSRQNAMPRVRRSLLLRGTALMAEAAGRRATATFGVLLILNGLQATAYALAAGVVVGAVPEAIRAGSGTDEAMRLMTAAAIIGVVFTAGIVADPLQRLLVVVMEQRLDRHLKTLLFRAVTAPQGLSHLENDIAATRIAIATGAATGVPPRIFVNRLAAVVPAYVQTLTCAALLSRFNWWAPCLIGLALGLERIWVTADITDAAAASSSSAKQLRRAGYFRDLALGSAIPKESRIFGLSGWLIERFEAHWNSAMRAVWRARGRRQGIAVAATGALIGAYGYTVVVIARSAARGDLSVGDVATFVGAALGMTAIVWTADPEWGLRAAGRALVETSTLSFDWRPTSLSGNAQPPATLEKEIRLTTVGFRYPGSSVPVFASLDLVIPAGCSTAIVGRNGSGKTTLVKLLARLYEPDSGLIEVDGRPLRDFELSAWRRRLAIVFQDFPRYEVSARENIGFGCPTLLSDEESDAIERSAASAQILHTLRNLPNGLWTTLSRRYRGGVDLSGGEWQRVALARAMAAIEGGAHVLVLDEPTASLDVHSEARLVDDFLKATSGRTTIVVSHRLTTVRHADRIVVLDAGTVAEEGTHEQLLRSGGWYSRMFQVQAAQFQHPDSCERVR